MKQYRKLTALILALTLCLTALAGCSSGGSNSNGDDGSGIIVVANSPDEAVDNDGDKEPLGEASGFTFDFESLDYAFTGTDNAEFYYIKVYPVVNGEESNSASFQSDKIDANDSNSYSGTIEGETLLAGDYIAHVVASASGYKSSDIQTSGTSTLLAEPSVTANWNTGESGGMMMPGMEAEPATTDEPAEEAPVTADITITPGDDITSSFTLVVMNEAGEEVYRNNNATAEPINLTAADLGADELTTEDVYTVTVTVNPVPGYTLPAEETTTQITERMMFGPPM